MADMHSFGSMTLRPDGILHAMFDFGDVSPVDAASEYLAARDELIGSNRVPVLVEIINIPYVDRSIREFLMGGMTPPPCRAVVVSDPAFLTMFRTYQLVDPTDVPTAIFATVEAAVAWIHTQTAAG
ncbi:MAG: hypothetical protein OEX97_05170 [Acidimicrobiia bacterium]|nr:hypothetical protein [Acidimicrobiia bacterium]